MNRFSTQKILAYGFLSLGLILTGCLTDDKGDESGGPVITSQPADATVASGSTATFTVVASGSGTLTYQWKKNGNDIPGATSATLVYDVGQGDDGAAFTCKVTDSDGSTTSNAAHLHLGISSKNVTLGAQDSPTASALDLDTWTTFSSGTNGTAKNNSNIIDLVFAFSTADTAAALYSPNVAKNGTNGTNGFSFMSDWPSANTTQIKVVQVADWNTVTTAGAIENLFTNGQNPSPIGKVRIVAGTTVVAKSNSGLYVLIRVQSVVQSASGVAVLNGKAMW
jgi:beta-galactosidase